MSSRSRVEEYIQKIGRLRGEDEGTLEETASLEGVEDKAGGAAGREQREELKNLQAYLQQRRSVRELVKELRQEIFTYLDDVDKDQEERKFTEVGETSSLLSLEEAEAAEEEEEREPPEVESIQPISWYQMELRHLKYHGEKVVRDPGLERAKELTKKTPPDTINVNKVYVFISRIKKGERSTVNRYFSTLWKREVVIKSISKNKMTCDELVKFLPREIDACLKLKHKYIIQYLETFQCILKAYIVMEIAEKGSLTKYIRERGKLDSVVYQKFFSQLVEVIVYLFQHGTFHRKLCTDNILISREENIKLCDFAYSKTSEPLAAPGGLTETYCGVLAFMAPELLACQPYDPYLSEVWSMGVVLYAMVYGVLPFDPTYPHILLKRLKSPLLVLKSYPDTPYACLSLLQNMLTGVERRVNIYTIAEDPWVRGGRRPRHQESIAWPSPKLEPWVETKVKIEALKEKMNDQIMESIQNYTPDSTFDKIEEMRKRKEKHERIPKKMEWLYQFYGGDGSNDK